MFQHNTYAVSWLPLHTSISQYYIHPVRLWGWGNHITSCRPDTSAQCHYKQYNYYHLPFCSCLYIKLVHSDASFCKLKPASYIGFPLLWQFWSMCRRLSCILIIKHTSVTPDIINNACSLITKMTAAWFLIAVDAWDLVGSLELDIQWHCII